MTKQIAVLLQLVIVVVMAGFGAFNFAEGNFGMAVSGFFAAGTGFGFACSIAMHK